MFSILLAGLLVGALLHARLGRQWDLSSASRLVLLYVLIGYCGIPMIFVTLAAMMDPEWTTRVLRLPASELEGFFGWAYLGMSLIATMCLRYRGMFTIGPAVCWAVYFFGATLVHLNGHTGGPAVGHQYVVAVLLSHLSISVVLAIALGLSGLLSTSSAQAFADAHGASR